MKSNILDLIGIVCIMLRENLEGLGCWLLEKVGEGEFPSNEKFIYGFIIQLN